MFKKVVLLALAVSVAAGYASSRGSGDAAAAPDPLTCAGYPEKRVFLESQGWYLAPGSSGVGRHIHVGTCFPHGQTVKGVVEFDVRVMLHDNPGTVGLLRLSVGSTVVTKVPISLSCAGDCTQWYKVRYDTSQWPYDGRQEFRFTANISKMPDDGKRMYQSTGWQAYFANGKPVKNYRSYDMIIARGWYENFSYANASLESAYPWGPVSGVWRPVVKFKPGSSTGATWMATIDPSFHALNAGTVVATGSGSGKKTLEIDTSRLSNGVHRLVLLAHDVRSTGTNTGVQMLPFTVQN